MPSPVARNPAKNPSVLAGARWAAPHRVTPSASGAGRSAASVKTWTLSVQRVIAYGLWGPYQSWLPGAR